MKLRLNEEFDPIDELVQAMSAVKWAPRAIWPHHVWPKNSTPVWHSSKTDAGYEVEVELPGFKEDEVKVTIDDGILEVVAENEATKSIEEEGDAKVETYVKSRRCLRLRLDDEVKSDQVSGTLDSGMLKLLLPTELKKKPSKRVIHLT